MNNPIKKHFQKVYNETGKKPFTFIQPFCLLILPLIVVIADAVLMETSIDEQTGVILLVAGVAISWIAFIAIPFVRFGKGGFGVLFLSILASLMFFCSFILWPFLKFAFRAGGAVFQANLGNTTASVNSSRKAGATKGKASALNWFEYEGNVWKDEKEVMPEDLPASSLDEGSYSYDQNNDARSKGYENAADAERSGRKWNGTSWE